MFRPVCQINIGDNEFEFVTDANFVTGWRKFTDTGEVSIPHKFQRNNVNIFVGENNLFNRGDKTEIRVGHFPNKELIFEGYLKNITPSIPVKMEFEDSMYLLKQTNITMSFKTTSLQNLIESALAEAISKSSGYIKEGLEEIEVDVVEAELGAFRFSNVNIVKILDQLKKTYALTSYFVGKTLRVGLAYYGDGNEHVFTYGEDIIDSESDLNYVKEEDVKLRVRAKSLMPDNTLVEVEFGDEGGDLREIFKYNAKESELREWAEREIDNLRFEGFRGSFKTFMEKIVRHGDVVQIVDSFNPDRTGSYFVEAVEYEFGVNGYFQYITLGKRAA